MKGGKGAFGSHAKNVTPALLEALKEKKITVCKPVTYSVVHILIAMHSLANALSKEI
jgi:hypothetical protein